MANWSNPTLTSTYTNFLGELKNRDDDLAKQFDGTTSSNLATGTIRWNSTANRWQKWNGSAWAELTGTYALTALTTTSNASIGGTLAVTGATTLAAATATTPATGDNSTKVATTAYVRAQAYAPLASPALTGTPTVPTAAVNTNTTQAASTAFVRSQVANDAPSKTGVGASGTWGINVSGNAATASSTPYYLRNDHGTNEIKGGTGDGASYSTYNMTIRSWHGIGFRDFTDNATVNAFLDCRTGNFSTKGQLISTVATGTAPLTVTSTTRVPNLNAATAGSADTVTTNANLTGDVTSVGNATAIAAGVIVNADINAAAGIVDTKLATIATAGKVSNSATTATSNNTASAIVARDGSGNFSAGTITAALTGTASGNVRQGGGSGQGANTIYIGWLGSQLGLQIDATNFGATWPIGVSGNAATATTATNCSRSVLAGNGITGGGALSADRTITLGTPGSLTGSTTNAVTTTSHTHEVTVNLGVTGGTTAGPVITSSAGTNATIPSASNSASGAVTTSAQTFAGTKTFQDGVRGGSVRNTGTLDIEAGTSGEGALYLEASATAAGNVRSITIFNNTTASTGNEVRVINTGTLQRISSSIKYKKDVELLENQYADAIINNAKPTWYRSKCEADNPDWGHYGFIAEELVQIDPRLVCLTPDEDGSYLHSDGERYEPEGVQYQSFVPLLVNVIQRQRKTIEDMQTALAALETRIAALEA